MLRHSVSPPRPRRRAAGRLSEFCQRRLTSIGDAGELLAVDGLARDDQLAGLLEVVGTVDAQRRRQPVAVEIPDRDLPSVDRPPYDLLGPPVGGADVLNPGPVAQV